MSDIIITDIRKTKKGYFSIFTNGEYALSVDDEIIFKNKLKIGCKVDIDKLKELNNQSLYTRCLSKSIDILTRRQNSSKELSDKLLRYYPQEIVEKVIDKLFDIEYLDDKKFCKSYISKYLDYKKNSVKKVKFDLMQKGIDSEMIEMCLNEISIDESELVRDLVLKKYLGKLIKGENKKVYDAILRRGFTYSDAKIGIDMAIEELNVK